MPALPSSIGRYNVIAALGQGAMGTVYKAVDPAIDRIVAIKTISLARAAEDGEFYEARFSQEAKTVGKLNHPNIVAVYDVGRTDEIAWMAMEFVDGQELKSLMVDGRAMETATAVELAAQVAEGLAFAHARDIVHRDVKPANVMVGRGDDGFVAKVADFGIARDPTSAVKTMTGVVLGSPRYMSPEQVQGRNVGPHSDVFSFGVMLYEMLSGAAPFDADSVSAIMYRIVHEPERPLVQLNARVLPELQQLVSRALAKAPEQRPTMKDLARALRDLSRMLTAPDSTIPTAREMARDLTMPHAEAIARPVSKSFDSAAATMRLQTMAASASPAPSAPAPEPFPIIPAALLGTLAGIALVLGIFLAI